MKSKLAVVSGGSRGIGKAIVSCLASNGYNIAFSYKNDRDSALNLRTDVMENHGVQCFLRQMDVANNDSVFEFFDSVEKELGTVDLLVNNAGITRDGLLANLTANDILTVINTNLIGTLSCCQQVIPSMMRQRSGSIINISSVAAQKPGKGQSNYAAAKGGVEALTRALAVELAPRNIRVNAVAPGIVNTDMSRNLVDSNLDEIQSRLLVKRLAEPTEIAEAVCFLADPNSYMTGEVLPVNGGLKML